MPIYVASLPKSNQKSTPDFENKGLELVRSNAGKSGIYGFPLYPQIAYKNYISLLPAFMKATIDNERIPCTKIGYPFKMEVEKLIPIPLPTLIVTYDPPLPGDDEKRLIDTYSATVFTQGKEKFFSIKSYNHATVKALITIRRGSRVNARCRIPANCINISGYQGFRTIQKIFSAFLLTQTYPAFTSKSSKEGAYDSVKGIVSSKRKYTLEDLQASKRARLDEDNDEEMETDEETGEETVFGLVDFEMGEKTGSQDERILFAYPKLEILHGWGTAGDLPATDGISLPYFSGLLDEDFSYLPDVIRSYFLASLGGDKEEIMKEFKELKGAYGMFARSESGLIFQHLALGIRLAIECQARCFPIISGEKYYGVALAGANFVVSAQNAAFEPLDFGAFSADVAKMSIHDVALEKIMARLSLLPNDTTYRKGEKRLKRALDVKTARALHEQVMMRKMKDGVDEEISKLMADLSFSQTYTPVTVEKVLEAFNLIRSESTPGDEVPMYLGEGVGVSESLELRVLSMFGPIAPSLRSMGGKKWNVPDTGEPDTASMVPQGKKAKSLHTIVIAKKDLFQAARDYTAMVQDRAILTKAERASNFKATICTGEERDKLWNGLKAFFSQIEKSPEFEKKKVAADAKDIGGSKILNEDGEDDVDIDDF